MSSASPHSHPPISSAEWLVMRAFWRRGPATVSEIVIDLEGQTHWKPRTVQTLIRRLAQKGALTHVQCGREFIYRPVVAEADCEHAASRDFLDRIFGGKLAPLLAAFVERGECSAEEIKDLRALLDSPEKGEPKP